MSAKDRESIVLSEIKRMEKAGKAGSHVQSHMKAIKSWLGWNDIRISKKIQIKGVNLRPTLKHEVTPDQSELMKILNAADSRERAAISLVAFSGLRLEVLGNFHGSDGLTLGDMPELSIVDNKVKFEKIPALIVVRQELSETGNKYHTFLGREGAEYITSFLEYRIQHGENLTRDSPVITPIRQKTHFIVTHNIGSILRGPMRSAGNMNRPYVLRSYFSTQLMVAESKGVLRDYRSHFMGHIGDIENRYSTSKNNLPHHVIESMREAYSIVCEYLETSFDKESISGLYDKFVREVVLSILAIPEEDIKDKPTDKVLDMVRSEMSVFLKEADEDLNAPISTDNSEVPRQKKQLIVNKSELASYLEKEYTFASPLDDKDVIVWEP